nr:nucleotidyl transferase AbiEii/AbiGii toxin family protein [Spirochaetota bacterium]
MAIKRVNHLKEIITTLSESDVDFIICGGVALVLHGIERMTMDLDLSVDLREQNLQRFIDAMKKLGLVPR